MMKKPCARCGLTTFRGWVFKDGSNICEPCHDELLWWFFVRALMLPPTEPERLEIPTVPLYKYTRLSVLSHSRREKP